jgi:hypothetical protein
VKPAGGSDDDKEKGVECVCVCESVWCVCV